MANRTRSDSPTKTCTMEGCENALRARGLCSTHYNRAVLGERRHVKQATNCVTCGAPLARTVRHHRPTCSVACRQLLQHGAPASQQAEWERDAITRARRAGATVIERVVRADVFGRDGWVCYLCGLVLDPQADSFDPRSATVDHVVPLSAGGTHTLDNTRTACLSCNSSKGSALVPTGGPL